MGQFSTEIYIPPGSTLSGNQHPTAQKTSSTLQQQPKTSVNLLDCSQYRWQRRLEEIATVARLHPAAKIDVASVDFFNRIDNIAATRPRNWQH